MSAQQQTLHLIREITSDGVVSFTELTNLASYLNENREARKTWPGTAVFDVLRDILRDGRVDPHELDGLNLILEGVEIICAGSSKWSGSEVTKEPDKKASPNLEDSTIEALKPTVGEESVVINLPHAADLELPSLLTGDIKHRYDGVHLPSFSCDCEDWKKNRDSYPEKSLARACRCIVSAIVNELDENPDLLGGSPPVLEEVMRTAAASGRGLEAVAQWKSVKIANRHFVISTGKTSWCNVYATSLDNAFEKFSFHRDYKRWGFGDQPKDADLLKEFFAEAYESVFG